MPAPLDYADYDGIPSYPLALDEALGRERTSTSALWAGRHPERLEPALNAMNLCLLC